MRKKYDKWIVVIIGVFVAASILLVGCAINTKDNLEDLNFMSSIFDSDKDYIVHSMSSEDQDKAKQYQEENKKRAEERHNRYKYYFGDSEAYITTDATSVAGAPIQIFVDPESAFKQSKIDYKDAYKVIANKFSLSSVNKFNMDSYITYGWQCSVDDPELYGKCADITKLLIIYKNSYNHK